MKNLIKHIFVFISIISISSCVKEISIDTGVGEKQVVVYGLIVFNPNDPQKTIPDTIKLSMSVDYLNNESKSLINNALVIVRDSLLQSSDTLTLLKDGAYITNKLRPAIGGIYKLDVYLNNGEHLTSFTYINRLADFRRLYCVDTTRSVGPVGPIPAGGFVVLDAWDPAGQGDRGQGDNYRFKFFVKRKSNPNNPYFKKNPITDWQYYYQPSNYVLASESAGGNRNQIDKESPFALPILLSVMGVEEELLEDKPIYFPGDSIKVQILSITQENLFFYNRMVAELENGAGGGFSGLFAEPVANVTTNIEYVNSTKKALGWFGGASLAEKSVEMIDYLNN